MSHVNPANPNADAYRLRIATAALKRIANLTHAHGCDSSAPLYECCCLDEYHADIAMAALDDMNLCDAQATDP